MRSCTWHFPLWSKVISVLSPGARVWKCEIAYQVSESRVDSHMPSMVSSVLLTMVKSRSFAAAWVTYAIGLKEIARADTAASARFMSNILATPDAYAVEAGRDGNPLDAMPDPTDGDAPASFL